VLARHLVFGVILMLACIVCIRLYVSRSFCPLSIFMRLFFAYVLRGHSIIAAVRQAAGVESLGLPLYRDGLLIGGRVDSRWSLERMESVEVGGG
jgi:hypothetical protein